ncbi:sugar-transfer associated ATP-grasp domain-containing protein [Spartinivicinus ruber]|uniref:sugar-transfer associated ATP-grasp domain-containing protein n=1 Tax=Spartinivicinus ruber TaxID=2683272 RepID=UPI0013D87D58|nr:sugar-transfer associated ATP-grasp domain-containing protein [Spartinivicinus ruber]
MVKIFEVTSSLNAFSKQNRVNFFYVLWRFIICYFKGFGLKEFLTYPLLQKIPADLITYREYSNFEKRVNPRSTGIVEFDKWIQACVWKANNIPHVKTYGFMGPRSSVFHLNEQILVDKEIRDILEVIAYPFVIKPAAGGHGDGFDIVDEYDQQAKMVKLRSGKHKTIKDLQYEYFSKCDWVFQELIVQHQTLAQVNASSVNTARILTATNEKGEFILLDGMMKFGTAGSMIDNMGAGGIGCHISADGKLSKGYSVHGDEAFECHPGSGINLTGRTIPFYQEAIEAVKLAHSCLPRPQFLGWDVAITPNGPVIVEVNSFMAVYVNQKYGNGYRQTGLKAFLEG